MKIPIKYYEEINKESFYWVDGELEESIPVIEWIEGVPYKISYI